ncbi:hypothetical protein Taro_005594 [Colocasia esculenta]|uniref:Uncharacterized protein n=1 Tax=Colocasia esculenta TaxID=4460 RepID=A0A843TLD4_COLES|nr:hypothetical protein [Colocasia esculenta]
MRLGRATRQHRRALYGRRDYSPVATELIVAISEFLVAGEQEIIHTKLFFFPVASAATYTDSHLEVDQRRRPYERDGPIVRILRSCCDSTLVAFWNVTNAPSLSLCLI